MLRVAKQAILLIEPRDWIIDRGSITVSGPKGSLKALSNWLRQKIGFAIPNQSVSNLFRLGDKPNYEEVGNYVFSVSSREIEKVALGLNLPAIAFMGLNDHCEEGLWKHEAIDSNPEYLRLKDSLAKADRLSKAGIGSTSYLLIAVFLELPTPELTAELESIGWYVKHLDRNPYLK